MLKQSLINQRICREPGVDCVTVTKCQYWRFDENAQKFVKIGEGPIKSSDPSRSCHGSFGLSAEEINKFQEFLERVDYWRKNNCQANLSGIDSAPQAVGQSDQRRYDGVVEADLGLVAPADEEVTGTGSDRSAD